MDDVLQGELLEPGDRLLDDHDLELIAAGREPKGGAALLAEGENHPRTLFDARQKIAELHILKKQAKAMAELEGFIQAHREQAATLFAGKLMVIDGLIREMAVKNDDGDIVGLDTTGVSEKRLDTLLRYLDQFEKRAYGGHTVKHEHSGEVDVRHLILQANKGIEAGD